MFKDIFNEIIRQKNISLYKVAKDTKIPKTIIYDWASGAREPVSEYILVLADYLGCSVDFLLDRNEEEVKPVLKVASPGIKRPLLAKKSLIEDAVYNRPFEIGVHISVDDVLSSNDDFRVIMQDDSMKGESVFEGTEVLIRRDVTPQNGDLAAVYVNGEIVLRKFFQNGDTVVLEGASSDVLPEEYKANEIKILGRAVERRCMI